MRASRAAIAVRADRTGTAELLPVPGTPAGTGDRRAVPVARFGQRDRPARLIPAGQAAGHRHVGRGPYCDAAAQAVGQPRISNTGGIVAAPAVVSRGSGEIGIWMAGQEAAGSIVIDKRIAG